MKAHPSLRLIDGGRASLDTALRTVTSGDPIFAAIEAHKDAFHRAMTSCRVQAKIEERDDSGLEAAQNANSTDWDVAHAAAEELSSVLPTTRAGLAALLDYVVAFNRNEFTLSDDPKHYCSEHLLWPNYSGAELPFAFRLLLNVRDALAALAVQS